MAITLPAFNYLTNCQIKLRPALDWFRKLPDSLLMTGHLTLSWWIVILVFPILRTLNGRIRIRSASAPFLPPINTAEGWQDGQIPVVAMAFIIAWQDPVAIYGSAYNRSL
jgi:hypothetical protein